MGDTPTPTSIPSGARPVPVLLPGRRTGLSLVAGLVLFLLLSAPIPHLEALIHEGLPSAPCSVSSAPDKQVAWFLSDGVLPVARFPVACAPGPPGVPPLHPDRAARSLSALAQWDIFLGLGLPLVPATGFTPLAGPGVAPAATLDPAGEWYPIPPVKRVATQEKMAAITFDDGPHPWLTAEYLAALQAKGARATFFLVGRQAERYTTMARQIASKGHEVANHSLGHTDMRQWNRTTVEADLETANTILKEIVGQKPKYFRPPYGRWHQEIAHASAAAKITAIGWSVDPQDWRDPPVETIVTRVVEKIHPGAIILLHEGHRSTAAALPPLLDRLQNMGYQLVTVSELLAAGTAIRGGNP